MEEVEIKKKSPVVKILTISILTIVLVVLVFVAIFAYNLAFPKSHAAPDFPEISTDSCFEFPNGQVYCPKDIEPGNQTVEIDEEIINQILYGFQAQNLRSSPTGDTPKMEIILEGDNFNSEVISHEINTEKGIIENEDLIISMTPQVVVDIISSPSVNDAVIQAAKDGLILAKPIASYTTLFSKGYYELYKNFEQEQIAPTGSLTTSGPEEGFVPLKFLE